MMKFVGIHVENDMTPKEKCDIMLNALVGEKHIPIWWGTRNKAFDNVTPAEVFMVDEERVVNYLMQFRHGDYS